MKERKLFGCASATSGSFESGRRVCHGLDTPAWVFAAVVGTCIWVSRPCDGQIEVSAYISNAGSNSVSVIDTETNTVVGSPLTVGSQPAGVAVTPDGKYAYVTNNGSNMISIIDTATNTVIGSITLGSQPAGIAITPDGKYAYVTNTNIQGFAGHTVSVINTATNTVLGSPITVGSGAFGVAITPDGKYAYVANNHGTTVSVINTATNTVIGLPIAVGNSPVGVAVTPNGKYVFVTNNSDNTVSVISTATHSVVGPPIAVGNDPAGVVITPDGRFAYVANNGSGAVNSNTVSVIDIATDTVVGSVKVGNKPLGIDVTPDGKYVYVTNSNDGTVSVINTATNKMVGSPIAVGSFPLAFGFFVGPNIIVAQGGPLSVANDAALTPLGFGRFVDFNGGTLKTTGDVITSRTISLLANGGTIDTNGFNAAFSGDIINSGALTKIGAGSLTLSGNNTYTGGTVLDAGTLVVASAQALGLGDVVVNGGVLGADQQTINVKGNYTQNAGGTLQLGIGGTAAGQYDFLNVSGHATLGGTLQLISLNGFQPKISDKLTLVSAGGGISGKFTSVLDQFSPVITLDLIYGPNTLVLEFGSDFAAFAQTSNQLAVAKLLDKVALDPREAQLISFLSNEPVVNLPGDLEKTSPDGLTAFYEISFSSANIQRLNLEGRLDDIRSGSNGFSSNMKVNGATVNLEDKAGVDGKSSKSVVEPILQPGPQNRWGVWVTGFGDFVNVDGDGNANGYNFTTGGVSLGVDYRITDQLAIGVMGDYSHTWTSLNPTGDIDVNSGRGGLYATWFSHGIYLNGVIYGGHNNYESSRSSLGGLATGGTEGAEWSTFVSGGYDFHFGHLSVGPIAALQYTYVNIDGFSENGSVAPLAIHSGSAESLRSDFGLRAFYQWQIGKILIEPSLKAAWEHEYKYSALPITAGFAGIPGPSATFFGPNEGHDSAVLSAGVSAQLTPAISTYVNYDGQLGRGNYDSNAVTGGFRISF
jgi:outer membrane autotransporter protein